METSVCSNWARIPRILCVRWWWSLGESLPDANDYSGIIPHQIWASPISPALKSRPIEDVKLVEYVPADDIPCFVYPTCETDGEACRLYFKLQVYYFNSGSIKDGMDFPH